MMDADDPRHGTNAGAIKHWRDGEQACEACSLGRSRLSKSARLDRDRGNPRIVRLGVTAHDIIATTPRAQLASATGISGHKLVRLQDAGPEARVNRRTRERILATRSSDFWTPIGVQRRLQALHAIGWSMLAFSEAYDFHAAVLRKLMTRDVQHVRRDFAERVIAAYDDACMAPKHGRGASRARNTALRNGWLPPLDWDDIDKDAEPGEVAGTAAGRGEVLRELDGLGAGITEVCRHLDISRVALERWVDRNKMRPIFTRMVARESGERRVG